MALDKKVLEQIDDLNTADKIIYLIATKTFASPSEMMADVGMLIGRQVLADEEWRWAVTDMLISDGPFEGIGDTKIDRIYQFVDDCVAKAKPVIDNELHAFEDEIAKQDNAGRTFRPYSLRELSEKPEKEWLIDKVFGVQEIGMIFGMPGSGKSFALVDFAIECAIGGLWAGRFQVSRPLNVAYFAGEGVAGMAGRFTQACRAKGVSLDTANISFFELVPQLGDLTSPESVTKMVQEQLQYQSSGGRPFDIIIIDTLHTATVGVDENSAQDMGIVLSNIKYICKTLGTNVLLAHHTNKGGDTERGSIAMRGAMDVMIKCEASPKTKGQHTLRNIKLKDGDQWHPQKFQLCKGEYSASIEWANPSDPDEIEEEVEKIEQRHKEDAIRAAIDVLVSVYPEWLTFNGLAAKMKAQHNTQRKDARTAVNQAIEDGHVITRPGTNKSVLHCVDPDIIVARDQDVALP